MYFTKGKQRAFELLMQQKPGFDRYQSGCAGDDEDCGTCPPKSQSPSRGTLRFSGTPSSEPFLPS